MARPKKLTWHPEVLDAAGRQAARRLAKAAPEFYLAGGTGLALRLGHRVSLDLDLFSAGNTLDERRREALTRTLKETGPVELQESTEGALHLLLGRTRVSLLHYRYPLLAAPSPWEGLAIASASDIAAMKISAIIGRGSRKDFVDLYALSAPDGLERRLREAIERFSASEDFLLQAARALVYFDDAEREPMPRLLRPIEWVAVKAFFNREAPRLVRRLLDRP